MKTLLVFGTRYGATTGTSGEIAKILREEGFEVNIVNLKKEKISHISEYELIVVGSGIQMGKWVGEAEEFLKKFQKEFKNKKLALFVSSMKTVSEREGKTGDIAHSRKVCLEEKVTKYGLNSVALGFFGGVLDYNKMGFLMRKTMGWLKPQLEKYGFKEGSPGIYDLRDWAEIQLWAKELARKAKAN